MSWAVVYGCYLGQRGGKKSHGCFAVSQYSMLAFKRDLQKVETNGKH